jgi:hypothetical protein
MISEKFCRQGFNVDQKVKRQGEVRIKVSRFFPRPFDISFKILEYIIDKY